MLDVDLIERQTELESEIAAIEATLRPLERDLAAKKQEHDLISRLVGVRAGPPIDSEAWQPAPAAIRPVRIGPTLRLNAASTHPGAPNDGGEGRAFTEYHGIWADICEVHGWPTGKDSAHRVVIREDPEVHRTVAHRCAYDGETYS